MVYFIISHPQLRVSRANAAIFHAVKQKAVEYPDRLLICDLYDEYPRFHIDVEREKRRLLQADIVFLQHPFFWYSMPPLLKLWFDSVWTQGFAYGPGGVALQNKSLQLSITTGGQDIAYRSEGSNRYTIEQFNYNVEQTARLCRMKYLPPIVLHGANRASDQEITSHAEAVLKRLCDQVESCQGRTMSPLSKEL